MPKQRIIRQQALAEAEIHEADLYPSRRKHPGRSPPQVDAFHYAGVWLRERYRDRQDVFVGADTLLYYRRGLPEFRLEPDVFVAFGDFPDLSAGYKLWEAGVVPQFALDVLGGLEPLQDLVRRRENCRRLGVREYWRFDPLGGLLEGPGGSCRVLGERLAPGGRYAPIEPSPSGWPCSQVVGLELSERGGRLRLRDLAAGREYGYLDEMTAELRRSEQRTAEHIAARKRSEREFLEARAARKRSERQLSEARAARKRSERELSEARAARKRSERELSEARAARKRSEREFLEARAARKRSEREFLEALTARKAAEGTVRQLEVELAKKGASAPQGSNAEV